MRCTVCKDKGASKWKDGSKTHMSCRITGPCRRGKR
jgi:hypothetical protein